ncbi:MAG: HAD-IIA family hydrolase [Armatimonadota bacterium]|nr:HAD-IIA family hydrolase [bacterium]
MNTEKLTYVFDLDGVIYRGLEPQPHAKEVLATLRSRGHAVRFYTNNAAKSRQSYVSKLEKMGIPTPIDEIMTSSYATALYFIEQNAVGKTVYRVGEKGMAEELEAAGMHVIYDQDEPGAKIDFVTVGLDRDFNYRKLARAQKAILDGAKFIATNEDATFPMEAGALLPGGGCMVAAVRTATSVEPFVVGKPEIYAYNKILELTKCTPDRSIMVGDRLDTDIMVGNRAGAQTVLVLTGVTSRDEAESAMGKLSPDRIIETLEELL